ncbi:MAG: DedA family protein [Candidatus Eremiobacteraeota bacterium]|nr:DedA family protein [Candidatus Eremiobacteraeota bacterium]
MEHLTQIFHDLVVHLGYPGLFIVMFLGNIGTPVGTEVVMPTAGALASQGHFTALLSLPAWIVVALVGTVGEICGATTLYEVGYHGGLPFVHRYGRYVGFKERELGHVQRFYGKFGHWAVFLARFVPFVRGVASLPAGLSRMNLPLFLASTAIGSAIFCFGLAYLGQVAGNHLDAITAVLHKAALLIVVVIVVLIVAAVFVIRARSKKKAPDDLAA